MTNKIDLSKLPHMDVVDMPSDINGYLGKFRSTLRGAYNANRNNESAIHIFKETLEYAVGILQAAEAAPDVETPVEPEAPAGSEPSTSSPGKSTKRSERAAKR